MLFEGLRDASPHQSFTQMATYVHMLKGVYKDDMESTKKEGEKRKEKRVGRGSPEVFRALGF